MTVNVYLNVVRAHWRLGKTRAYVWLATLFVSSAAWLLEAIDD